MSAVAVEFLTAFAKAISASALYPGGHLSVERALDALHGKFSDLWREGERPLFSFLGDEVVYGNMPLREMRGWEWSARLAEVGVQRLQFDHEVSREELEEFLDDILARITLSTIDTSDARQLRPSRIRFGSVGIRGEESEPTEDIPTATVSFTLREEADAVRWLHADLNAGHE